MKRSVLVLLVCLSLLLTGCGWLDGSYVSVTPHQEERQTNQSEAVVASDYLDLMRALADMIAAGTESGVITLVDYPSDSLENGMSTAIRYAKETYPIGAYAVEEIGYEIGTNSGIPAVAVTITYRHSRAEIQNIQELPDMEQAEKAIAKALESYEASVVMLVETYQEMDFTQLVQDYALAHPEAVMETPQVTVGIYGDTDARVVELTFTYQTSRDSLRQMQSQVQPMFDSAVLYVSGSGSQRQKFSQLYAFLMERFDYTIETSITPAYSLLCHGVGDSRAFAMVYAAMCRDAGLECRIVTGTRAGEPRTWNIVLDNGYYYHVDLLWCYENGSYREFTDSEMSGYVWDYSAYPACTGFYAAATEAETVLEETE